MTKDPDTIASMFGGKEEFGSDMPTLGQVGDDATGMFRTLFGEPRPRNADQFLEAMAELNISVEDMGDAEVGIDYDPNEGVYQGYSANVMVYLKPDYYDEDDQEEMVEFSTAGFKSRDDLIDMLIKFGVRASNVTDCG